jgi:hypothetical protein
MSCGGFVCYNLKIEILEFLENMAQIIMKSDAKSFLNFQLWYASNIVQLVV